jgi:CYTH domain
MREHHDGLEIELKFRPDEPESTLLRDLAALFQPEYGFAQWPPCANLDIYLDTPSLALYARDSPLRLRRWATPFRYKEAVSANFKYPPKIDQGLRRRELKTLLTESEARQVCDGAIIGGSLEHAADFARSVASADISFTPQLLITIHSNVYVLRPYDRNVLSRGKASDLLILSFEHWAAQKVSLADCGRLLRTGMIDYDSEIPVTRFFEVELEIFSGPENFPVAEELYDRAFRHLEKRGTEMSLRSKYHRAVEVTEGRPFA